MSKGLQNALDLHLAIIVLVNQFVVFLKVAVLHDIGSAVAQC